MSKDTIETAQDTNFFFIRVKCRASVVKDVRNMSLALGIRTGSLLHAHCTCVAGIGGLCNHSSALMMEVASYSLFGYTTVPPEESPTSLRCKWIGQGVNDGH